jgi:carboxyl-terminal processing protease
MKTVNLRHPRTAASALRKKRTVGTGRAGARSVMGAICTLIVGVPLSAGAQTHKTDPYEVLDQIGHALKIVEDEYFEPADQGELLDGAIRGMLSELDPHSAYFNRSDLEIFQGSTTGKFGGIGVEVEFSDGDVIVIAPVEGSPADRAGIKPGDQIVALDGRPLHGQKPDELVRLMRGEIGTKLLLTIRNATDKQLRDVVVVREEIQVASVQTVPMTGNVAYFKIKAFQEGTHRELLQALGKLRKSRGAPSGILLDLRNNPGGLVREATALADEFLSSGSIYSTRHRGRILKEARAHSGGAYTEGPLVVLINEYSASAAELLAGALSDSGRARVVGARTFGKGSVQTILNLGHGGALKLTTALYYTPSGHTVQARGIHPHFTVDPGYIKGAALRALKESDLAGHVPSDFEAEDEEERGALPTNEDLHLGVARNIPENPEASADIALRVAHRLVRGIVPKKQDLVPQKQESVPQKEDLSAVENSGAAPENGQN